MTNKQKQSLLTFLGYDTGGVDGIWGDKSQSATMQFQQAFGLDPDWVAGEQTQQALRHAVCYGIPVREDVTDINVGNKTGTFWDEIEFFTRDEFKCQCFLYNDPPFCDGFPVEPQEKMVRTVNEIRRRLGVPVTIVEAGGSGVRCPRHNASQQVKGATNSLHLTGNAADLHSSKSPEEMARVAEEVMGKTGEIGIYSWGIHVGIGKYSRFRG
jgi:peptidoglycan hydrolase-like protein with peptidoglycan-binding domain